MTEPGFSPTGIRFQNIEKRYGGLYALRRVSLEVAPGECLVFAGRNGSGKTTLLRIAARLVRASSGEVTYHTAEGQTCATAPSGFVAHATMVYDELTAEVNLLLFARLLGIAEPAARAEALLTEVGLLDRRSSLVRTFSRGMRQRMAIARALLDQPSILFLDEPATGLDPQGITWLAESLRRMREAGRTILMSLHGESEISSLANRAVRLEGGAIAADTARGASLHTILTFAGA